MMGVKSTKYITREKAINRIIEMSRLFMADNYEEIERASFEPDINLRKFVKAWVIVPRHHLESWSDKMLGDYMDNPFFRYSMFDNYLVKEEGK